MTELRAPDGKFRVVGVDTFDGTHWVYGDYTSREDAIAKARTEGGEMLKTHVYDDKGVHLYEAGMF